MKSLKATINKIKKPMAKIWSWVCILFEKPITHLIIQLLSGLITLTSVVYLINLYYAPTATPNKGIQFNDPIFNFLNDWQTLIAGVLALVGAWLTIRQMRIQTKKQVEIENSRFEQQQKQIDLQAYQIQNDRYTKLLNIKKTLYNPTQEYKTYLTQIYLQKNGFEAMIDENQRKNFFNELKQIEFIDWRLSEFLMRLESADRDFFHIYSHINGAKLETYKTLLISKIIILICILDELIFFLSSHPLKNAFPRKLETEKLISEFKKSLFYFSLKDDDKSKNAIIEELKKPIIIISKESEEIFKKFD